MKEIIYIDVLFVINLMVTYFLLMSASAIIKAPAKRLRVLAASAVGGLASGVILLPPLNTFFMLLIRLFLSGILILISFGFGEKRKFIRNIAVFYAVNFVFAGLMMAIWLLFKPKGMMYNNTAVYFNISVFKLILTACVCYVILSLGNKLFRSAAPGNRSYEATVTLGEKSVRVPALLDTGNTLTDGFTGLPVIVADYSAVREIIPEEIRPFFKSEALNTELLPDEWKKHIRAVPYSSIGGRGVLPAFKADKVTVKDVKGETEFMDIITAVTFRGISRGEYGLLLNGLMLEHTGGKRVEKITARH
ncbi:MAG: sigma-E processing peptidase SpoIIGA [Clostridiales bacterium]|nr:sigma-E processing peptidase SpoIIGA [Clostridiales bacterium]